MTVSPSDVLLRAIAILGELEVPYWLCNGTLLGLVRDGKLIPWDADLDIGVHGHIDVGQLIEAFSAEGFDLIDDGAGTDYVTFATEGIKLDFNLFRRRGDEYVTLWRVPKRSALSRLIVGTAARLSLQLPQARWLWTLEGYALPAAGLFPLADQSYLGVEMSVPRDPEAVLEYIYGPDWRLPKRDYDWRSDGAHNAN